MNAAKVILMIMIILTMSTGVPVTTGSQEKLATVLVSWTHHMWCP